MLLDHHQPLAAAAAALTAARTAIDACRAVVDALARHAGTPRPLHPPERVSVLLWVHDQLRTVAATGSWQTFATAAAGSGITGRVWATGRTAVVPVVTEDPDYIALRPDVRSEVCVPIHDPDGRRIGVLDLEWIEPVELEPWRRTAEAVARLLGQRIAALGGPPAESRSEKLLRHVAAMTVATSEWELRAATLAAARDVSGLAAAVLVLPGPAPGPASAQGPEPASASEPEPGPGPQPEPKPGSVPTAGAAPASRPEPNPAPGDAQDELTARILASISAAEPMGVDRLIDRIHRSGAAYTLGEPDLPASTEIKPLTAIGIGTLIAVPIGPPETGGVLLAADRRVARPDATTVNLMELLAAQAWACLDRLRGLARLRERASSDPLTGLRHHGPFGERMATTTPGRTALLAVDVDRFKNVNDTYGHQAGDRVLIELARALEGALRHGDELYRVGGDEFVAVVEVSRPEEAVGIGERLVRAARRLDHTISVGVAVQRHRESPEHTMRRADAALYEVKRRGRDGVRLAPG